MPASNETAGRIADAEQGFRKVIAVVPDGWDGYNDLGNFYLRQAKYPEAISQYKQALDLTPDNAQVYSNLGSAYLDSGDPKLLPVAEQNLQKRRSRLTRPTRCWLTLPRFHLKKTNTRRR